VTTQSAWLPPEYVNLPTSTAYAFEVDDAVLVTMARLLGLCWQYNYERTPALTPDEVAELAGRSRSALYRHLKLLREMGWIRVEQVGRRIVIRPLVKRRDGQPVPATTSTKEPNPALPATGDELLTALAEIGVENPKRDQLARLDLDPLWVHAWHLWARHPHRQGLTNPAGNIILKLESREPPPARFLKEANEQRRLREWLREREEALDAENEKEVEQLEPQPQPDPLLVEMQTLWTQALSELQLQMTRAIGWINIMEQNIPFVNR
jgi:DNA-binding transcriptional ArsR family regulator